MRDFWQRLVKLWVIIGPYRKKTVILFIVMLLAALSETASLAMIIPLLTAITENGQMEGLGKYFVQLVSFLPTNNVLVPIFGLFLLLITTKCLLNILFDYLSSNFAWGLSENWYNEIFHSYLYRPYSFVLNQKQGVLLNNLLGEPGSAAQSIMRILQLLTKVIIVICLYGLLLHANWQITLILTTTASVIFALVHGISRKYSHLAGRQKISLHQTQNAIASESIVTMRQIKTFSLEKLFAQRFAEINRNLKRLRVKFHVLQGLSGPLGEVLVAVCLIVMALILFKNPSHSSTRSMLPLLGLIVVVSERLLVNISFIITQRMHIHFLLPSLVLVHDLVKRYDDEVLDIGESFSGLHDDIILQNVGFSYNSGRPVFDSLSLRIQKNKMTAFIGPSGIGKSTLADLLLGLIKPSKGHILINSKSLETYNLNSWRKRIGFVSQETIIFNTTIEENIRFGKVDATHEEVVAAAKLAVMHDFILSLPDGYNTGVGDRGLMLSGGQRQRIAIARAIIRNPDLYVFDEATSSLDLESEKLIKKAIESLGGNKTIIIITHRLSTIDNADIVFDLGQMRSVCLADK